MIELPTEAEPVRVIEGDCLSVLRGLPSGSVNAVITDPPYSQRTHDGHDTTKGDGYDGSARKSLGYGAWSEADVELYVPEMSRVSAGWVVIMTDYTLMPCIMKSLEKCGRYVFAPLPFFAPGSRVRLTGDGPSSWTDWIIVARTKKQIRWGTLPGGYLAGEGWRDREHMGGKPNKLMRALVRDYSREGDLILDPFAGAGTTGVAAARENRLCLLVERDPEYAEKCRKRVSQSMGTGLLAGLA